VPTGWPAGLCTGCRRCTARACRTLSLCPAFPGPGWQEALLDTVGVPQPLRSDISAALPALDALPQRYPGPPGPAQARGARAALSAPERDCAKLGITPGLDQAAPVIPQH
jgi:hypothetical protein